MMTFQPRQKAAGGYCALLPHLAEPTMAAERVGRQGGPVSPGPLWETAAEVSGQPGYTGDRRGHVSPPHSVLSGKLAWEPAELCVHLCLTNPGSRGEISARVAGKSHAGIFFFFGAEQDHTYIEKPGVPVATPAMREEVLLVHVTQSDFFPRRPLMLLLM